jgi:hypothetical protein
MPAGAEEAPEVGFSLQNVVTDPIHKGSDRVWVSYYESDVLGGKASSFRVFQRPAEAPAPQPCGPTAARPFLERQVGDAVITICSSVLKRPSMARDYWTAVDFTSDLQQVDWLRG